MTGMHINSRVMFERTLVQRRLQKMLHAAKSCSTNTLRVEVRALMGLQNKLVTPEGRKEFSRACQSLSPEMRRIVEQLKAKNMNIGA